MAFAYPSGMAFGFDRTVLSGGVGAVTGLGQVAVTASLDSTSSLGAPAVPQLGTNGQVLNLATGAATTVLGAAGAMGKGPLKTRRNLATGAFTYGLTTLVGGWLIPLIMRGGAPVAGVRRASGTAFRPAASSSTFTGAAAPASSGGAATQSQY